MSWRVSVIPAHPSYWIMSALTNDVFILARYAGLYKAIQSAGAAVSFGVDATAAPVSWPSDPFADV